MSQLNQFQPPKHTIDAPTNLFYDQGAKIVKTAYPSPRKIVQIPTITPVSPLTTPPLFTREIIDTTNKTQLTEIIPKSPNN